MATYESKKYAIQGTAKQHSCTAVADGSVSKCGINL